MPSKDKLDIAKQVIAEQMPGKKVVERTRPAADAGTRIRRMTATAQTASMVTIKKKHSDQRMEADSAASDSGPPDDVVVVRVTGENQKDSIADRDKKVLVDVTKKRIVGFQG